MDLKVASFIEILLRKCHFLKNIANRNKTFVQNYHGTCKYLIKKIELLSLCTF